MKDQPSTTVEPAPPLWELEWQLVEIASREAGLDPSRVTPNSRLIEDLGMDSLELVEFIVAVEEAFNVTLPDDGPREIFLQPVTLRSLAEWVRQHWGTGAANHHRRPEQREPADWTDCAPCMQLGGSMAFEEWMDGPLYHPIGLNREGYPQYRRRTDGMRCVRVPQAEVWIGSADHDALPDQQPPHCVCLDAFLIDAEPVSNTAFTRFLNSVEKIDPAMLREWCGVEVCDPRGEQFPLRQTRHGWRPIAGTAQQPVVLVSWYGANAYSLWANRLDWRSYRGEDTIMPLAPACATPVSAERWPVFSCLPTEAQWEYAARGSEASTDADGAAALGPGRTSHPVLVAQHRIGVTYTPTTLPAAPVGMRLGMSSFGLHHMAGNVWQWCRDWYAPDFYQQPEASVANPQNAHPTGIRCERGGSWVGPAELARPCYRRGRPPTARGRCLGFRCVGLAGDLRGLI
jgi:acyl carrier protein